MLDDFLTEALGRFDAWLLRVCDHEERRAQLLAGDGAGGWDGVRNLIRPDVERLAPPESSGPKQLIPDGDHAMVRLGAALGLSELELEVVLVALAPHLEPRYQAVYSVLQDDLQQPRPTERLLVAVLGADPERGAALADAMGPGGRLATSGVLRREDGTYPPLAQPLDLADDVVTVLRGDGKPAVPGALHQRWRTGTGATGRRPRMQVVHGRGDRTARAEELAESGTVLLDVGVPRGATATDVARTAWRIGLVEQSLPLIDLSALDEPEVVEVANALERLVGELGGRAWLVARDAVPLPVPHDEAVAPTYGDRRTAWLDEARIRGIELDGGAASRLATRHRFGAREVGRVFDAADDLSEADLDAAAARMGVGHVRHSMRLTPTRTFDDMVLRDTTSDALDRLVFYVRNRDRVAQERGLGARHQVERGPVALFSGRSGTGKTLAAEAVAEALGRTIHTVDLARLVSKYIGETEKHVDEVLRQAEQASAVLFFDEADALFSSRQEQTSNASEQFANMLAGYLLQRIEVHDGLVILATNLRHAIDEAFLRRFQFRIEFPMPEPEERQRIWDLLLPDGDARDDDLDTTRIARAHRLAGGDIRNAALKAVFLAEQRGERLGQQDLDRAVALEMLEMGRLSRRVAGGRGGAPPTASHGGASEADRGDLLRACLDDLHDQLDAFLRARFLKEIHLVHGSPTEDRLAGKRPAVSLALFRLAARRGGDGLRAGFILSTWSHLAEEESELLGVVHDAVSQLQPAPVHGRPTTLRMQESHDFDLLHRFWSSHDHPVRPSIVLDVEIE